MHLRPRSDIDPDLFAVDEVAEILDGVAASFVEAATDSIVPTIEAPRAVKRRTRRRRTRPRSRTISVRMARRNTALTKIAGFATVARPIDLDGEHALHVRPTTRGECLGQDRPCPWVSCAYHLYLDVNPETGSIKINFPELEPWELKHTCALDVADRGGITLEEVGEIMNLTRERIRQVEVRGLHKLKANVPNPNDGERTAEAREADVERVELARAAVEMDVRARAKARDRGDGYDD